MRTGSKEKLSALHESVAENERLIKQYGDTVVRGKYDPEAEQKAIALIRQIKQGDEEAFQSLIVQYKQLVDSMAKRFAPSLGLIDANTNADGIGMEELRQDGYVALYKAAVSYEPEEDSKGKAVRFGLYAKICIRNAYISEVRRYKRTLRRLEQEKETVHLKQGRLEWIQANMHQVQTETEDGVLFKQICEVLSPYEKKVFMQYIQGKPPREIAAELNKTEKSVSNAIYRVKSKNKGLLDN